MSFVFIQLMIMSMSFAPCCSNVKTCCSPSMVELIMATSSV